MRWVARRPAIAAAWGLLLLTLIFGLAGGVALWQAEEYRDQADELRVEAEGARVDADSARRTARGTELITLKGHTSQVRCVAFSADGKRIVSRDFDKTVMLWDAAGNP